MPGAGTKIITGYNFGGTYAVGAWAYGLWYIWEYWHAGWGFGLLAWYAFMRAIIWPVWVVLALMQHAAKRLKDIEASQRATAKVLGVDEGTVRNNLGKRGAEKSAEPLSKMAEKPTTEAASADFSAPPWFQDGDPAKLAKTQAKRKQNDAERQRQAAAQMFKFPLLGI